MSITGYQIKDVAKRSGFTPATLRYYEDIGLLPQPPRTASGYRVYDDATVERLAFIARAKQLGCSLDEITELNHAWNGGQCGPIQDRLRRLVTEKIAVARRHIDELTALTHDLEAVVGTLGVHRPEGGCDDQCGCITTPASSARSATSSLSKSTTSFNPAILAPFAETTRQPVTLGVKPPRPPEPIPIACTLRPEDIDTRLDEWNTVLAHVHQRTTTDSGIRLMFADTVSVPELARLALAEQQCCTFFTFAITIDANAIQLEIGAPDDATPLLQALFGSPA